VAGYTDLASAKVQLNLSDAVDGDDADIAYLSEIDIEVSRTFELKTGRIFGGSASATAKTVDGSELRSDVLMLPVPVRSVTSVAIIGDLAETLTSNDYVLWMPTRDTGDYFALRRIDGGWWPRKSGINRVTITAVWSDTAAGGSVPQEIIDAATFVCVETFRQRKSSPTGEIGADGFTFRPRNPWNFENVKETINRYKVARPRVGF